MRPKTAIMILSLMLFLSVITILVLVSEKGSDNKVILSEPSENQVSSQETAKDTKTDLQKEIENKDYSAYVDPELERKKDEARLRLEKLEALRASTQLN